MVEFNGLLGYALTVAEPSVTMVRQAMNDHRRTSANLETDALFLRLEVPSSMTVRVGIASAMPVSCDAGSWRTLHARRHLDRQASGDGFQISHRNTVMSVNLPIEQILVYGNMPSAVFYKTPIWRKVRYEALTIYGNRCQLCGTTAKKSTLHVDHIKPRFLYPESCLEIQNLQVLCEECHTAKGIEYLDNFHSKVTTLPACEMRDILRIERYCLMLGMRHPKNKAELEYWGNGVRAASKKHRQRWRIFLFFCFQEKLNYYQAINIKIADFLLTSQAKSLRFTKFTFGKNQQDLLFDIGGCYFPPSIYSLLADDQVLSADSNLTRSLS